MDKIIDGVDVSECEHYRAEIETKMPYGEYETLKDKCHYSGIEIIQNCKGNKGCIYKQLQRVKAELKKYEDMAKKGLEEFKDVGGCWGCGLQLQLNQDIEDIKKLKAENERLKQEKQELSIEIVSLIGKLFTLEKSSNDLSQGINKLYKTLQEIREYILSLNYESEELRTIQDKINSAYTFNEKITHK